MTEADPDAGAKGKTRSAWRTFALLVGIVGLAALFGIVGWAEVRQNWANGDPWFTGIQFAPLATPIAGLLAAWVAITTAKWGLDSARATRRKDHTRWETDRRSEAERRRAERHDAIERTLRDRFHELVKLLAADELRAREGASFAIVALADDWLAHYRDDPSKAQSEQQVCLDVLISQLRDPLPDRVDATASARVAAFKRTIQGLISSRLGTIEGDKVLPGVWSSLKLSFDGCQFHNLDFSNRTLGGTTVSFKGAGFWGDSASFDGARFTGDLVSFVGASFGAERTRFDHAQFAVRSVLLIDSRFNGQSVSFDEAHFVVTEVVSFDHANFHDTNVSFVGTHFTGECVRFGNTSIKGKSLWMAGAHFTTRTASFGFSFVDVEHVELDSLITTHSAGGLAKLRAAPHVSAEGAVFGADLKDVPPCKVCAALTG